MAVSGLVGVSVLGLEGAVQEAEVGEVLGPGGSFLSGARVAINWGDLSAPTVGVVGATGLTGYPGLTSTPVYGYHAYNAPGAYKIIVNVEEFDGTELWQMTNAIIQTTFVRGAGIPVAAQAGTATGEVPLVKFYNPAFASLPPFAVVDWGDGTTIGSAPIHFSPFPGYPEAIVVTGSHTYARPGLYVVTVNLLSLPHPLNVSYAQATAGVLSYGVTTTLVGVS